MRRIVPKFEIDPDGRMQLPSEFSAKFKNEDVIVFWKDDHVKVMLYAAYQRIISATIPEDGFPGATGKEGAGAIFAEFEREILRERTRAGLAHARQNGQRLSRPATAALHAAESGNCIAPALANPKSLAACRLAVLRFGESWE